jgi:hypothetical protein
VPNFGIGREPGFITTMKVPLPSRVLARS